MIHWLLKKIFGDKNQREQKKLWPLVRRINEIEKGYQALSDDELRAKTGEFKARIEEGRQKRGIPALLEQARKLESELRSDEAKPIRRRAYELEQEILQELLPEAFAAVKNACRRLCGRDIMVRGHAIRWDMVPFDVQLIGGMVLHSGRIAEMATGEGKTLVATMPLYLNALAGKNVQLVTVNDYLAARDSEWMGSIYRFLGLTVGCIQHDQPPPLRRQQYECDITYGTNAEFGFDYLRDNGMATTLEDQVQRGHFFAIVDEVDSILIDEARTPLIISGPAVASSNIQIYQQYRPQVAELVRAQTLLCNRLMDEARQLVEKAKKGGDSGGEKDGAAGQAGRLLWKVKNGMPKNNQLMRMLEDPDVIKLLDKTELELHADTKKEELHRLKEELFFAIDEKGHEADLTAKGREYLSKDPDAFVLPDLVNQFHEIDMNQETPKLERERLKADIQRAFDEKSQRIHAISQLLRAYCIYEKDVEYVVQDGKVVIVDEFTGRLMTGRRWSDGLHQAVEAKEGVSVEQENQTLATITIQNYFRLYDKLAGMTGTAETEAAEFHDIYKLDVVVIPTNKPCVRKDHNDIVYKTRREKYNAIIKEIEEEHRKGRPILVGTVSVEVSELLSRMLKRAGVVHSVLNAKYHQMEAEIVARAGQPGAVTIATNMAGRGTDIKLGPGVPERGGLHVLGTERHEARRIDRQLRGRCARQGDPGSSRFYISLEDDLMRLFGSGRIANIMEKVGMEEGEPLESKLLNRSIETAQKRVEQHNYSIRKRTLEYDDVMNKQREVIYGFRNEVLRTENPRQMIFEVIEEVLADRVETHLPADKDPADWDVQGLINWANLTFPLGIRREQIEPAIQQAADAKGRSEGPDPAVEFLLGRVQAAYAAKEANEDPVALKTLERYVVLNAIDRLWQEHLYNMDSLRTGIGLRAYGQRDPLVEYKAEAFKLFEEMQGQVKNEVANNTFRSSTSLAAFEKFLAALPKQMLHAQSTAFGGGAAAPSGAEQPQRPQGAPRADAVEEAIASVARPVRRETRKVGRNEPCPCGSGKKFKHCCGR
jgi:preprotein translocase subunit SecA